MTQQQENNTPSEWKSTAFGDCAYLVRDTVSPSDIEEVPYIGLEHIGENTLSLVGHGTSQDVVSAKSSFRRGDVLFGKLRPYFRKTIRAPFDGICSTDIWVVRPEAHIDPGFLFYTMAKQQFVDFASQTSEGTRMPRAKWDYVAQIQLRIPPLPEQRRIAHILGTLDDKIELNRRMNETLDEMARAIFKDWFVDFGPVRAKMQGRDPYLPDHMWKLFPDRLVDSELGQIPDGWEVGTVKDLCVNIQSGGTPKRMSPEYWNGEIPWFKTGELLDRPLLDSEEHITEAGLTSSSCKLWPKGTILIALYASPTVGRLGILERPATSNQACSALMPKAEFGTVFSYYTMLFTRHQLRHIASGSAQQNINQSIVKAHNVVIPQSQVASQFNQTVMPIYDKIVANMHQTVTLSEMRDTLLPKLVSGEVRVNT